MKMFLKRRWKLLLGILLVLGALVLAFYFGGNTPGAQGWNVSSRNDSQNNDSQNAETIDPQKPQMPEEGQTPPEVPESGQAPPDVPALPDPAPGEDGTNPPELPDLPDRPDTPPDASQEPLNPPPDAEITDPYPPELQQVPAQPDTPEADPASPEEYTCTISISCASILEHMDWLDEDKAELVPEDGVLLAETTVSFAPGATVFDILKQVTKDKKIHMEYTQAPLYNTVYIEGIGNLYEFDCGELSGWMYSVNGGFPSFGCSSEALENGDVICWLYTCEQGNDIGGGQS